MFERKRKTKDPCAGCGLHRERCICALIPRLELRTRVSLIVHAKELKRTTNTGKLAIAALTNSEMLVRGREGQALTISLPPNYESILLYPSDDAIDLADFRPQGPVHLLVPDGNWRQAGKVHLRHPELAPIRRVKLARTGKEGGELRKEHFQDGMATLEAIALALGHLEGEPVRDRLLALYRAKVHATLLGRGVVL